MRKTTFIKPDLDVYFNAMPVIGIWLKAEYKCANTREELTNLVHKWFKDADESTNEWKRNWLLIAAENLYSILTRKSYQSKIL